MSAISPALATNHGEQRQVTRTNLYLAANLRWSGNSIAVRVRDLSAHGARVEAAVLPPAGTTVELSRGRLRASGSAIWTRGNRAGLQLLDSIAVKDWMAPASHAAQQQVDAVVAAVRSGTQPRAWPGAADEQAPPVRNDLELARSLLLRLSDELADDPAVIARHGERLQALDLVQQVLEALMHDRRSGTGQLADLRRAASAALMG